MPEVRHLHSISPYVGRLSAERARKLIETHTSIGETIADPFCGSGTIALEAWAIERHSISSDLNPYAVAVTKAKLNPPADQASALRVLRRLKARADAAIQSVAIEAVPEYIRAMYHPRTLREILAWQAVLSTRGYAFYFGCFLNLLHHQRPGFLSYPASHVTPYLRTKAFPESEFPELYEYRDVYSRLVRKVTRTLTEGPLLKSEIKRVVGISDASVAKRRRSKVDAIITSPPYMSELDYGRDNRVRLWFCGCDDWNTLDGVISPNRSIFMTMMGRFLAQSQSWLRSNGKLVVVMGDSRRSGKRIDIPNAVIRLAENVSPRLSLVDSHENDIPSGRRVIKEKSGTLKETTLIFKNMGG